MVQDKATLEQVRNMADKEKEDYLNLVKSRKKGGENQQVYKATFRPTGPQEMKDLYYIR